MVLTILIAIQAFTFTSFGASRDYLDQNLDAYYKHVEGQDARYKEWMQLEQSRILQPTTIDTTGILGNTYARLQVNPGFTAPASLLMGTTYNVYEAPKVFYTSPIDPFEDEYIKYFKTQMESIRRSTGIQ